MPVTIRPPIVETVLFKKDTVKLLLFIIAELVVIFELITLVKFETPGTFNVLIVAFVIILEFVVKFVVNVLIDDTKLQFIEFKTFLLCQN